MFSHVVALYRSVGTPEIRHGIFSYEGPANAIIRTALSDCSKLTAAYGSLELYRLEGNELEFEFHLPGNENGRFYSGLKEFVQRNGALGKGRFPSNVYIHELAWADCDDVTPPPIQALKQVCRLVELLTQLAVGVDRESDPDAYNLFFALPPDGEKPPRTFLLSTRVGVTLIDHPLSHIGLLEEILHPKNETKAHVSERKLMMCMAVASVIENHQEDGNLLSTIVKEWREVLSTYRVNLQTYVYRFSFDRARRELAQAEVDYGSKLSGVLGDIAGKMLALPVSFAALVPLHAAKSWFEAAVYLIGLCVVTMVLLLVLHNQRLQVERLLHSFNVIFDEFKSKLPTYPLKLQSLLQTTIEQVDRQGKSLTSTFQMLQWLAWLPALLACVVVVVKYRETLGALIFELPASATLPEVLMPWFLSP
ncbi:hypothetical protein PF66_04185 [Pseudomonas asplenii]|uniref:Uncharacterized protein n=1 Tax=Pseudomonas asplenii TaxID=53407 RepID=A0A0M9GER9_9PSED|nr:hypothetical protein [Pseudomonas fuscovaginae]KPA89333.1 hypothetical protein PF66_04185 [Pseudomonas fuscovaginae]